MTGRVVRFGDAHSDTEVLLPWFVNGTLDADEHQRVLLHLGECAHCRSEEQELRAFHAEYAADDTAADPTRAFRRLRATIARAPDPWRVRVLRRWQGLVRQPGRWLPWAVGLQVALIAAVGALLVDTDHRALVYRTLGATEVAPQRTGSIAVVFDPRTTEDEIRRIVRAAGARIVDGPTTTDAYVLD